MDARAISSFREVAVAVAALHKNRFSPSTNASIRISREGSQMRNLFQRRVAVTPTLVISLAIVTIVLGGVMAFVATELL